MRAVIQRVSSASVTVENENVAEIQAGLLILIGIEESDSKEDIDWLCAKISRVRIFDDAQGVMNLSVRDKNGGIIAVSQFTLHALTKKGNRPSYIRAAKAEIAIPLYNEFLRRLELETGSPIQAGRFGADMKVSLVNDGPVTIIIDTKNKE